MKINPKFIYAYNNHGVSLFALGKTKEALEYFHRAIELNPNFGESYNNVGVALSQMGKKDEAHKALLQAVPLRPEWSYALFNLAISYLERGDREAARNLMNKLSNYDTNLADKVRESLNQKYVVNANSFTQN